MPILQGLTPELKRELLKQRGLRPEDGYDVLDTGHIVRSTATQPSEITSVGDTLRAGNAGARKPSNLESFGRGAAGGVIPAAGGLGGAALGIAAVGLAPETAGLSLLLPLLGGIGGAYGASALQEAVVPAETKAKLFSRPEDLAENPVASFAGNLAPNALAFNPVRSLGNVPALVSGARKLPQLARAVTPGASALTSAEAATLANAGINTGVALGQEVYNQVAHDDFNAGRLAANAILPSLLFTSPNKFGRKLGFTDIPQGRLYSPPEPTLPPKPAEPSFQPVPEDYSALFDPTTQLNQLQQDLALQAASRRRQQMLDKGEQQAAAKTAEYQRAKQADLDKVAKQTKALNDAASERQAAEIELEMKRNQIAAEQARVETANVGRELARLKRAKRGQEELEAPPTERELLAEQAEQEYRTGVRRAEESAMGPASELTKSFDKDALGNTKDRYARPFLLRDINKHPRQESFETQRVSDLYKTRDEAVTAADKIRAQLLQDEGILPELYVSTFNGENYYVVRVHKNSTKNRNAEESALPSLTPEEENAALFDPILQRNQLEEAPARRSEAERLAAEQRARAAAIANRRAQPPKGAEESALPTSSESPLGTKFGATPVRDYPPETRGPVRSLEDIEAERRGITLRRDVAARGRGGEYRHGTRTADLGPEAAGDIAGHEVVGHGYVRDMLTSSNPRDAKFALDGINAFTDYTGPKPKTVEEFLALPDAEQAKIEEAFAKALGVESFNRKKLELYGKKRDKFIDWWSDVRSNLRYRFGSAEPADLARLMSAGGKYAAPYGTRGEFAPRAAVKPPATTPEEAEARRAEESNLPAPEGVSDFDRYQQIQARMMELVRAKQTGSDEFVALWKENETLKNRNPDAPGMPPTRRYAEESAMGDAAAGAIPAPTNERIGRRSFANVLTARFDKVAEQFPNATGRYVSDTFHKWFGDADRLEGQIGNRLIAAASGYSPEEISRVYQQRHALDNKEPSPYTLTAKENELLGKLNAVYGDIDKLIGTSKLRRHQNVLSNEVAYTWAENLPKSAEYDTLFLDYTQKKGMSKKDAESLLEDYKGAIGHSEVTPGAKFGAIKRVEEIGLPWELIEPNFNVAASRYGRRLGNELSFAKHIEGDVKMLKALGIRDAKGRRFSDLPPAEQKKAEGFTSIADSEAVTQAMRSIYGFDTPQNPRLMAAARGVGSLVMQTGTAVRNLLQIPTSIAPYYGVNISSIGKALGRMNDRKARAFENNAIRASFKDFDAAGNFEGNPIAFIRYADKLVSVMRKYTGRDLSDRVEGMFHYSLGEELATAWFAQAKNHDIQARQMLHRFGDTLPNPVKDYFKPGASVSADDIARVAKRFVDAARGTYSPSGLPGVAIEGSVAPFLALSRWSIERSNTFWRDVVEPIRDHGNWMPLLKTAFAGVMTGAAIEQLNEVLSGKRGNDPTIKEALADGDADTLTAKAIGLAQLGSLAGIVSDAAKVGVNLAQGKGIKYHNPLSMPAATLAEQLATNTAQAAGAIQDGEDPFAILGEYLKNVTVMSSQNARYLQARTPEGGKEAERKERFRDYRVFEELTNRRSGETTKEPNRYEGLGARTFKRTDDLAAAMSLAPELVAKAISSSEGEDGKIDIERLRRKLRALKLNSYQTFPDALKNPRAFKEYYEHLSETQGEEAARERVRDFYLQREKNKIKTRAIPDL